jgi:hypothetical protein
MLIFHKFSNIKYIKMSNKFLQDCEFGNIKEQEILPVMKTFFNDDSISKLDKNNIFDFKGDNKYIELKSRHNILTKYPTTMVGYNKILKASQLNEDVYFFFCFDDCLCYWKFKKDYEFEIRKGGRRDRGISEIKDYVYIPINDLIKVQ